MRVSGSDPNHRKSDPLPPLDKQNGGVADPSDKDKYPPIDESLKSDILAALGRLKQNPATKHLPVIGFHREDTVELRVAAETAGLTLLVTEAAIVNHLPQLLERALELE